MLLSKLPSLVTRHPWRVIAAWVAALLVLASVAPGLKTSTDEKSFLPRSYESVRAQQVAVRAFPDHAGTSALFVVRRGDGARLGAADRARVAGLARRLAHGQPAAVTGVAPGPVSRDGRVALVAVGFARGAGDAKLLAGVRTLRREARSDLAGSGLDARMAGTAPQAADLDQAGKDADSIIALATIVLILLLLGTIFRSPLAALVPLVSVGVVSVVALALIGLGSRALHFQADSSVTSLLIVVLFGVGTDYIVFLLFRLRERLREGADARDAVAYSVRRVGLTIGSSAAVVIIAFLALMLSQLGSTRALAPSLAISVAVMLVAAVTLVPAVLALVGERIFWPSRRWRTAGDSRLAAALAHQAAHRPVRTGALAALVLVAFAATAAGFKPNYDQFGDLPRSADSSQAQRTLAASFPRLSADPAQVYVVGARSAAATAGLAAQLRRVAGVEGVSRPVAGRGGTIRLDVSLASASATANRALDVVEHGIRPVTRDSSAGRAVLVGGTTAVYVDVRRAIGRDYRVVFPVAALAIMLVIALLLRSVVAPLVLGAAVGLGFLAALGVTVAVFQGPGGQAGVLFTLPLTLYAFVVAIGTDYNILASTRLREEDETGAAEARALERTVRHSLPTIAAAGIILAGTFGALMLTPLTSLRELGFGVSVGILISAFGVAGLLLPSIASLLGRRLWWPSLRDPSPSRAAAPSAEPADQLR
ncbi:MAG: MMPL family transporter [Solirubrobacteraceae bacterium]